MSSTETVQKAINFMKNMDVALDNLCPDCKRIIKEELAGDQPASKARYNKTTATNGVDSYYDQQT